MRRFSAYARPFTRSGLAIPILSMVLLWGAPGAWSQSAPGLSAAIRREVLFPAAIPAGAYTLQQEWSAVGPEYSHMSGRTVQEGASRVWEAQPGKDTPAVDILYGPYVDLPAGDYVAFFRLKRVNETDEDSVGSLDAAVSGGQVVLNDQVLKPTDLPVGRWVETPLPFHHTGGKLECRLMWDGYCTLRADRISLYRVSGASLASLLHRAEPAAPSGNPRNLPIRSERRPFPELFPRSLAPAPRLFALDITRMSPSWKLALLSLQGLVNRTRPEIYLLCYPTDGSWLNWMKKKRWVAGSQMIRRPEELIRRFRNRIKGVVITDPALPASKNIATMLAGVEGGLAVSPSIARQLGLPVLADLRGRWHTNVDAYRWAFDHLWSRMNHHVVACLYPENMPLRDYLVENRVFTFWISGTIDGSRPYANPTAEARLMEQLLARMPTNIPVMGYPWAGKDVGMQEGPGVTLFAEFGKYLVGSVDCSNLSVHSGIRPVALKQRPAPPSPALDRSRVYVSWIMSDGDNLPVLTVNNFPQLWQQLQRGHVPIGWTVSPSASMLIPDILDYYYETASSRDEFIGAVSGIGYTYPESYGSRYRERSQVFDGFLAQTATYLKRSDLSIEWIMGITQTALIRRYVQQIPFLQALFPDYGRRILNYEDATYPLDRNTPVFHAVTSWDEHLSREEQISRLVAQVKSSTPPTRPAFLHLFIWNWGADLSMLPEVLRRLGPDYVAVRPDHLAHLYREELARDRVLVRAPASVTALEGWPLVLDGVVQNVSSKRLNIRMKVVSGLRNGAVKPASLRLSPAQKQSVVITGTPINPVLRLEAGIPSGPRDAAVSIHHIARAELAPLLPGAGVGALAHWPDAGGTLHFAGHYDGSELGHRGGQDKLVGETRAWIARPGIDDAGWIAYGPYAPLPAGRYLALFRLRRTGEGAGTVATLDTCVGGGMPVTSVRPVSAGDLPVGAFRVIPLVFQHPGGTVETRVNWEGKMPLEIESVDVFRVDGKDGQ